MERLNLAATLEELVRDPKRAHVIAAQQLLVTTRDTDHHLYQLLLAAALSPAFDAALLARIADGAGEWSRDEHERAFSRLLGSPLVRATSPGSWALDQEARVQFIDFQVATDGPQAVDERRALVVDLFDQRYVAAREAAAALGTVDDLLHAVSTDRHAEACDVIEDLEIRAATELVHVAGQRSPQAGVRSLQTTYEDLSNDGQLHLCEVLVRSWMGDELVSEDDRPLHEAWGWYFMARTANLRGDSAQALEHLDQVPDPAALDLLYATWHWAERAGALWQLNRFDEAFAALDSEIAIHESDHPDDANIVTPWLGRARLCGQLWRQREQVDAARRAVDTADEFGSTGWSAHARLTLADALRDNGDPAGAVLQAVHGLALARGAVGDTVDSQSLLVSRQAIAGAVSHLGPMAARLLATLSEQQRQLQISRGPAGHLDVMLARAQALVQGGATTAATEAYSTARGLAQERVPDRVSEVDAEEATWSGDLGMHREGAALNLELLRRADTGDLWEAGRYTTNAAADLLGCGAYDDAMELVDRARSVWVGLGHDSALALCDVMEGELLHRRGQLAEARRLLEGASRLEGSPAAGRLEFLARLSADEGDTGSAGQLALQAMNISIGVGERGPALERALLAATFLGRGPTPASADEPLQAAQRLVSARSDFVSWQPTSSTLLADDHAARAVRIMVTGFGTLQRRAGSALEHLTEAISLDSASGWYALEAYFVERALGRPKKALERLDSAIGLLGPMPLLAEALKAHRGSVLP